MMPMTTCPIHGGPMLWQMYPRMGWVCRQCQSSITTTTKANSE